MFFNIVAGGWFRVMVKNKGDPRKFEEDLNQLIERISHAISRDIRRRLIQLKDKLVEMHVSEKVKINHSVMELICAKYLLVKGYDVDVEYTLDTNLVCDIYGIKGGGSMIVEIETGYVPPEHALDPYTYCKARIASKIARYSNYATKFALGFPPHYTIPIPGIFMKPPRHRSKNEVEEVKELCDLYYKNPPVSLKEIRNARLHAIYIIDVDEGTTFEIDPTTYIQGLLSWNSFISLKGKKH